MTTDDRQQREQLVVAWIDAINQRDFDRFDELFASDYVNHNPPPGGQGGGVHGLKHFFQELCDGLDGFKYTIEELTHSNEHVMVRLVGRGRHVGRAMGAEPTGALAEVTVTHIFEIQNGRISARWADPDNPATLRTLAQ